MLAVPSTLQLLLAVVLVVLGVCGNLAVPFVSYRTRLRCPHITVLAVLDLTVTLLGPGTMLVTCIMGPTWLEPNSTLCQSLNVLSSWTQITCFLVLFSLAVYCQKVQNRIHSDQRRQAKLRTHLVFVVVCLLTGLLLSVPPLLGWSSYNGLLLSHNCVLQNNVKIFSNYSIFYIAFSAVIISISILFAVRAIRRRRPYPVELFWERHKLETVINDPEMTTNGSSNSASAKSLSKSCRSSRRSSLLSGRRSGVMSAYSSPISIRKASTWSRSLQGPSSVLLEILSRERTFDKQNGGNGNESCSAPEVRDHPIPGTTSGMIEHGPPGDPFVISSRVPYRYPRWTKMKNVFQSPRFLPPFKGFQQQRSLSRFLILGCCVRVFCWLPVYVLLVLQICSVYYLHQAHVFIRWLIFAQSSISSMLPLCDANYRQVWRRAAYSCLKTCAVQNKEHFELVSLRDVECRIEGSEQVRLREVIPLEVQRLS